MSAELLRRAAKTLREHAEALELPPMTTATPWTVEAEEEADCTSVVAEVLNVTTVIAVDVFSDECGAFIALMHPPVALALADWLEAQATDVENAVAAWSRDTSYIDEHLGGVAAHTEDMFRPCLTTARAILRESEEAPRG
jgi:hypothetical protein